ncbi:MAG: hypothetical protein ACR2P2_12560 [Nakamurella sp.]
MPTWLILTLAAVVLVLGAAVPALLAARRSRASTVEEPIESSRARLDALSYQLDTSATDVDTTAAARLRDTAEATLSVADDQQSGSADAEVDELLDRASTELTRARATARRQQRHRPGG